LLMFVLGDRFNAGTVGFKYGIRRATESREAKG